MLAVLKKGSLSCIHFDIAIVYVQVRDAVVLQRVISAHPEEWEVQHVFNLSRLGVGTPIWSKELDLVFYLAALNHLTLDLSQRFTGYEIDFASLFSKFEERSLNKVFFGLVRCNNHKVIRAL